MARRYTDPGAFDVCPFTRVARITERIPAYRTRERGAPSSLETPRYSVPMGAVGFEPT